MSAMIPDLETHFRGLVPPRDALLQELEAEATAARIPIVGPVVGELLFILARALGARSVLELGTATGYSAIYLAQAVAPAQGTVVTLELDPAMAARAQGNLRRAGLADRVDIRVGEALALMADLPGPFDLVFLDIDKESYRPALEPCAHLLRPGGLLVADNVGFAGAADFNRTLQADCRWRAVSLLCLLPQHSPEHDGLCLAVRLP